MYDLVAGPESTSEMQATQCLPAEIPFGMQFTGPIHTDCSEWLRRIEEGQ